MADHQDAQDGTPFWLQPVYTDARAAIVQPDRRIDATQCSLLYHRLSRLCKQSSIAEGVLGFDYPLNAYLANLH